VVANSIEGRDLTMMTISTVKAVKQNKPVIFFTGRVHCGESPASYMLQGVLDKLMDFSSR
jgi:murein tripeptide amidase MpaA